nr:11750_t:CDS:2 [Entrophospora candida]
MNFKLCNKDLEGYLNLTGFVNLKNLDCSNNQLTSLNVVDCLQLESIQCDSNKLTSLNLSGLNQLKVVSCSDNYLTNFDYFSSDLNFDNLIALNIRNNNLAGQDLSLEPLKNALKLEILDISNTDIDSGLEYLPKSLNIEEIYYSNEYRPESCLILFYPKEKKKEITELNINEESLEGYLKIEGFINLRELRCYNNQLISLEVVNCPNLELINCDHNQLKRLDIQNCFNLRTLSCQNNLLNKLDLSQNGKLEILNIDDNNFPPQDLSFLSHLFNLKGLGLGNGNEKRIKKGIYNHFVGSLKFLQNMAKLEILGIDNTDLSDDLEYLPDSVRFFWCSAKYRGDSKVKNIYNLLTGELGEKMTDEKFGFIKVTYDGDVKLVPKGYGEISNDSKHPKVTVSKLDIKEKSLEASLDLNNFVNLEELDCSFNQLSKLDLSNCFNLRKINCSNNILLTEVKLPLDGKKLEELNLENNNLSRQNLSCFSNLINLKELNIGSFEKIGAKVPEKNNIENKYNRFYGSLEPLKNLTKLESLDISSTDVDSGLEYLPDSLKVLKCFTDKKPEAKPLKTVITVPALTSQSELSLSEKEKLPLRLYNIGRGITDLETKNIEELKKHVDSKEQIDIKKNYATLSYV